MCTLFRFQGGGKSKDTRTIRRTCNKQIDSNSFPPLFFFLFEWYVYTQQSREKKRVRDREKKRKKEREKERDTRKKIISWEMPIYRRWMSCLAAPSRRQRSFISICIYPTLFSLSLSSFLIFISWFLWGVNVYILFLYTFLCVCVAVVCLFDHAHRVSLVYFMSSHIYIGCTLCAIFPASSTLKCLVDFDFFFLLHSLLFWTTHTHREREGKGATRIVYVRVNTCVKVTSLSGVKANWWKEWDEVGGFFFFFFHTILFYFFSHSIMGSVFQVTSEQI